MIHGIGLDVTEVARIRASTERHGDRFLRKIYTSAEVTYCQARTRKYEHLAARFAAKEAVLKALGTGVAQGTTLKQVEVTNDDNGKPGILLHGVARQMAQKLGVSRVHVSISHTETLAIAQVVMEVESS